MVSVYLISHSLCPRCYYFCRCCSSSPYWCAYDSARPSYIVRRRPGLFEEPFDLYKFRTMTDAVDAEGRLLPDEQRLTSFGRLLRNTSLDELPEFFNILNGEMSLVGPRPLLMEYLPRYTQEQARRHHAPPGLTGWAQVNGRNDLTWNEKFELDVWYVDNVSFLLDLRILWQTIWVVLVRRGVNQPGHATASAFTGSMIRNDKPSS